MSDGRPRKRDRLRRFLAPKTGRHTPTVPESAPSRSSRNETTTSTTTPTPSTQHLITPTEPPGGAIGDASFKSSPASQPAPTSATAAADTQTESAGEQPNSTTADSIQAQSLWSRAINSDGLSMQERKTLTDIGFGVDDQEMASAVGCMTDEILNKRKGKLWKVKFREEEVVLRDVGMKILCWVDKFKHIGDTIVQFDPVHAALPWAGFRFLLQVDMNHSILLNCLIMRGRCA